MRRALFITAANRPLYFRQTMDSWRKVRGFSDWNVVIRLEPSTFVADHLSIIDELQHEKLHVLVNPRTYGVLHHPWVGFNELFDHGYDFVVRAEDDLIVADDILEFFEWASETYKKDQEIAAIVGYSPHEKTQVTVGSTVLRTPYFSPWVWGTWHDRWDSYISGTWDHDYSTYNGSPGVESGWDWNLNTRVLPALNKKTIIPALSRVQNIGLFGVHGTPENFVQAPSFYENYHPSLDGERIDYRESDSIRHD